MPCLLAITLWQIRVESDLNAFFTSTEDADSRLLANLLQSGELSRRYLLVIEPSNPINHDTTSNLSASAFAAELVKQWQALAGVERVWYANQPPADWLAAVQSYAPYYSQVYSLKPELDAPDLLATDGLAKRAEGLKQALLLPQAAVVKAVAKQDPLLLSLQGFKNLQQQFQATAKNSHAVALILQSTPPALDSEAQQQLQTTIRSVFDVANAQSGAQFRLSWAGVPVFSVATHAEINQDVTWVSIASSVAVVLVFLGLFRSFATLHWIMLIQGAAFLVGVLATSLFFGHVHSLTLALGASLIGICVDYPIHILVHVARDKSSPQACVNLLWPSLFMGGLTTVIGYIAMGMTGFPGFEQIAVFALFSILAALALTRWILPALLTRISPKATPLPMVNQWLLFCQQRRKLLLSLVGIATVLAFFCLPQLRWMSDMQRLALNMDVLKKQDQTVREHFSSIQPGRFVLIHGDDFETALQRSEAAERQLLAMKQSGALKEYYGLFPWLSSQALQQDNSKFYQQAMTPAFAEAWRSAIGQAGLSVEKLGTLSTAPMPMLLPEQVLQTPVRQILSGQVLATTPEVVLSLWLGDHDPSALQQALQDLPGVRYFSQKDQLDHLAAVYRDRSLLMLAIGGLVMALFIYVQQRSVLKTGLTLLPAAIGTLFIFATWTLMGEELSFLHVIGLLLSISLCVDYGIFFMENRGGDSLITYQAIAVSTLSTVASFGALGLGKTPTLPILALSVSLGVGVGFLLCPILIPNKLQS
jgi:predicted exporter